MKNRLNFFVTGLFYLVLTGCGGLMNERSKISYFEGLKAEQLAYMLNFENVDLYVKEYLSGSGSPSRIKSVSETHYSKKADCNDTSLLIANVLADEGYEPNYLTMFDKRGNGHTVFFYEKEGKFGTKGIREADFKKPVFNSLEEVVKDFDLNFVYYFSGRFNLEYDWVNEGLDNEKLASNPREKFFFQNPLKKL